VVGVKVVARVMGLEPERMLRALVQALWVEVGAVEAAVLAVLVPQATVTLVVGATQVLRVLS
jgi:hypothetical protein